MFGLGRPKQVTEREATGEIERCYHEIRQTMRVSGVNLNFRTWAGYERFFPVMWDAMRPDVETRAFERAADEIRAAAVRSADALRQLYDVALAPLGKSQAYQIQAALRLYHYINPKLLLFTAVLRRALDGAAAGDRAAGAPVEPIERGVPAGIYPMEMVEEGAENEPTRELFDDIRRTLDLRSVNSDYRTLALWRDYLGVVWQHLKPVAERDDYRRASEELREQARRLARAMPFAVDLSRARIEELGEDAVAIIKTTDEFERLLPGLVINIALVELVWLPADVLVESPYPAAARGALRAERGGAK